MLLENVRNNCFFSTKKKVSVFRVQVGNHLWFKKAGRVLEGLYTQQVKETFISLYEHSDISHEEESITHVIECINNFSKSLHATNK